MNRLPFAIPLFIISDNPKPVIPGQRILQSNQSVQVARNLAGVSNPRIAYASEIPEKGPQRRLCEDSVGPFSGMTRREGRGKRTSKKNIC